MFTLVILGIPLSVLLLVTTLVVMLVTTTIEGPGPAYSVETKRFEQPRLLAANHNREYEQNALESWNAKCPT